jgi:thiamine pyrophosphate-dependent acetolactate synthase large subunit-like protein
VRLWSGRSWAIFGVRWQYSRSGCLARDYKTPSRAVDEARRRSEATRARSKMGAFFVLHALARHLPDNAVVVDEAVSSSLCLREFVRLGVATHDYYTSASGGLGWAMPASIGH